MKILVLGGFGFMGKNLMNTFTSTSHQCVVHYRSRRNGCDMLNYDNLKSVIEGTAPDIIVHAAAHVGSLSYVNSHASEVIHDNTMMYLNLYKAVSEVNKDIIIINPISNCSYPGIIDVQYETLWWDGRVHESIEAYGVAKKTGFIISECYKKQHEIKTINLIVPNAYGPNDYVDEQRTHAMNGIIMRMMKSQKNNNSNFLVWGSGSPIREWIYMPDVAKIIVDIIINKNFDLPNPINLGQESGISIIESVHMIKKILNYDVKIVTDLTKQDGAPIKVLGGNLFNEYFPHFKFTEFPEGIKNTIEYYRDLV